METTKHGEIIVQKCRMYLLAHQLNTSPVCASELASNDDQTSNNSNSTNQGMLEAGRVVTVRDLLKGLYEKACQQKLWGLVRHTAGMLGKRVEDLAKAVTDLLVRQKQVNSVLKLVKVR
jgi:phosphorylase kinase alpha/beta subunit